NGSLRQHRAPTQDLYFLDGSIWRDHRLHTGGSGNVVLLRQLRVLRLNDEFGLAVFLCDRLRLCRLNLRLNRRFEKYESWKASHDDRKRGSQDQTRTGEDPARTVVHPNLLLSTAASELPENHPERRN